MKVLLIGSGGRESALAYKIRQSKLLKELKVFPGNGGFPQSEILPKNSLNLKDKNSTVDFIRKEKFDLVIVGPEEPLVDGIADWLEEVGILCFGPSMYCAQLEGSKDFAKNLMREFNIPTAKYQTFTDYKLATEYVDTHSLPVVIKADGLAAGKGVTVCQNKDEALNALKEIFLDKRFGASGSRVVIEEFMQGEEASIFALSDGEDFIMLPALQDHKRAYDGDLGPNTGGMGAYCPAPIATSRVYDQVRTEVFKPMIEGLKKKGHPYKGLLYAGLMIQDQYAKVVEFNCRFGDPETQALMLMIEDDLLELFYNAAKGSLGKKEIKIRSGSSCVVVLAATGYPNDYIKDIPLNLKTGSQDIQIFHAGTTYKNDILVSSGGRVLGVSSYADNLRNAVDKAYQYLKSNPQQNTFYRSDIGFRAL
ncbi:MAG TPA: phosphoribosylamine--glycine ligase [Leptospiraceae bacterium]|nr:phosphoribosylamine--glycine ligase [Leptospiraceae bacterium]HMX31515.1 phosphoribosylamine--glycine ligase [Leptospiraceae bacterium]HMY31947.1 phosphoribosylamine--glycine ligase [Leptospiraceae bacterium]HMZ63189.1 phosphoribosylamine--glycine ligase [Leptospiraceae bacterium]HNA07650.1 phosphoribosylamine--glycine ligase [Leptospiraceae bacterium]